MFGLTDHQIRRYSRQIILPRVGGRGQRRLLDAKVLIVGAGGLGSPAALYLAAAGVGTLGIVDSDAVDLSNLHRQILHDTPDVGRPKTESAAETVKALNPDVALVLHQERITSQNALDIIQPYDVVVEGSDNFPTKYLVNDACILLGKPLVMGAVYQFEGQVAVFGLSRGPCYRCIFREAPPPGAVPSCEEAGVLGVVPGIIGSIQAAETLKLLLDVGEALSGRFLVFDALQASFMELELKRDPQCPVCGVDPVITELGDYGLDALDASCPIRTAPRSAPQGPDG